jgi:hypothetical protein
VRLSTRRRPAPAPASRSAFAGFRFPADVIVVAVHWYLRYGLSYRDIEGLPGRARCAGPSVTVYRWVQRFAPLFSRLRLRALLRRTVNASWMGTLSRSASTPLACSIRTRLFNADCSCSVTTSRR